MSLAHKDYHFLSSNCNKSHSSTLLIWNLSRQHAEGTVPAFYGAGALETHLQEGWCKSIKCFVPFLSQLDTCFKNILKIWIIAYSSFSSSKKVGLAGEPGWLDWPCLSLTLGNNLAPLKPSENISSCFSRLGSFNLSGGACWRWEESECLEPTPYQALNATIVAAPCAKTQGWIWGKNQTFG